MERIFAWLPNVCECNNKGVIKAKLIGIKFNLSVYYNLFYNMDKVKNRFSLTYSARQFIYKSLENDFDKETVAYLNLIV